MEIVSKTCRKCGGSGPFYKDKSKSDGLSSLCALCKKSYTKSWYKDNIVSGIKPRYIEDKVKANTRSKIYRKENSQKLRANYYQRKYGMFLSEFDSMYEAQNQCCAICGTHMIKGGKHHNTACVDHCHTTGKIRGMLCSLCNKALGNLKDNITSATNLVSYLERSEQNLAPVSHQPNPGP